MERLKQVFLDRGITVADLPKAIVIHELLGAAMAIGFWTVCPQLSDVPHLLVPGFQPLPAGSVDNEILSALKLNHHIFIILCTDQRSLQMTDGTVNHFCQ